MEDKATTLRWQMQLLPLARTPQDRRSARSLTDYQKRLTRVINGLTPWTTATRLAEMKHRYGSKMGDSQIIVVLDANDDPNNPLYEGAIISRQ